MANEMRSFTFGGTTHPVEDEKAGKTLDLSGSDLQLKDADGTVRSTVTIPTGGAKFTTFAVGLSNATYGDLCYIVPPTGMQTGDFLYVAPMVTTATAFGYWTNGQQQDHGASLVVQGLEYAPINQPMVFLAVDSTHVQYIPTTPARSLEAMLSDCAATVLDAWKALTSWKPSHGWITDRAVSLFKTSSTQYAVDDSSAYKRVFCYADGTYASLIPLTSGQASDKLDHAKQYYTNAWTFIDPNPCLDEPNAISLSYDGMSFMTTPLDTDGTVGELIPAVGRGSVYLPNNFAIVQGHWH